MAGSVLRQRMVDLSLARPRAGRRQGRLYLHLTRARGPFPSRNAAAVPSGHQGARVLDARSVPRAERDGVRGHRGGAGRGAGAWRQRALPDHPDGERRHPDGRQRRHGGVPQPQRRDACRVTLDARSDHRAAEAIVSPHRLRVLRLRHRLAFPQLLRDPGQGCARLRDPKAELLQPAMELDRGAPRAALRVPVRRQRGVPEQAAVLGERTRPQRRPSDGHVPRRTSRRRDGGDRHRPRFRHRRRQGREGRPLPADLRGGHRTRVCRRDRQDGGPGAAHRR